MFCTHCGKEIDKGSRFCCYCGGTTEPTPTEPVTVIPEPEAPAAAPEVPAAEPEMPFAPPDVPAPTEPVTVIPEPEVPAAEPEAPAYAPQTDFVYSQQPRQQTPYEPQPSFEGYNVQPEKVRKPLGKKLWAIVGAAAVVVIALILVLAISGAKRKNYEAAIALFDAKAYSEAAEAFETLGNYKDSAECAALSKQWATYAEAEELIETYSRSKAEQAREIFLSLGSFEDAKDKAEHCGNLIAYDDAEQLENAGDLKDALAAYQALGNFKDADSRALHCADTLAYADAQVAMEAGDFAAAAELLEGPANRNFEDAAELITYCGNKAAYAAAINTLSEGKYYEAYKAFTLLGAFEDAAERAKSCVQETPKSGQIYRNSAYPVKNTQLKVINSGASPMFYKLYTNGDLMCTFFIRAGESATVAIPAGIYSLNKAYGNMWFGPDDMFGDDGEYLKCKINNSFEFELKSAYNYTIKQGGSGDPVTSSDTNRQDF